MKKQSKETIVEETKKRLDKQIGIIGCSDQNQSYLAIFKQPSSTTAYGSNTQSVSFETANIRVNR